jgi:hypothetical protein
MHDLWISENIGHCIDGPGGNAPLFQGGNEWWPPAARIVALGRFDLDHIGAEISQRLPDP